MALSSEQVEVVREIVDETSFTSVSTLCSSLNAAQEAAMATDIDLWEEVKSDHLIVAGSKEGVDINAERDRAAIRRRVRLRLGMSAVSEATAASDPNAIRSFVLSGGSWIGTCENEY